MSSYTTNIPSSGQNPSDSQPEIQGNFNVLDSTISRNHTPMSSPSTAGKHKFLQMPEQASAPTTLANEGGLYTKEVDSATQLFFREENNGTEKQLTGSLSATSSGHIVLPGRIMIKWASGVTVNFTSNVATINLTGGNLGVVFAAAPFNIQTQIWQNSQNTNTIFIDGVTSPTVSAFVVRSSASQLKIDWMAIGRI